ncbi:ferredoxin [Pseudonocardia sulfidoxydans]
MPNLSDGTGANAALAFKQFRGPQRSRPPHGSRTQMQRIDVDVSACQGHGKCYRLAPRFLRPFDAHGRAEFDPEGFDENDANAIKRGEAAILACPERALTWR